MPMRLLSLLRRIELRAVLAALVAVAILHILATLAAPHFASAPAVARLAEALPLNSMKVLPPVGRSSQPVPYLAPDARYAMCRFDTTKTFKPYRRATRYTSSFTGHPSAST